MASRPALEALGVCKRYGDRDVLHNVDLIAHPGRLHGLLGPNGAGKTTLMRVALGLVRLDAGTVRLLDTSLNSPGPVPEGVGGFVETPAFYPYLSGRRNLALLTRLDGDRRSSGGEGIDQALAQVGLTVHAGKAVGGYSAGMRQRLGLAAALLRRPRLLFLDEPTTALDPAGARDVRALARRLAEDGVAVVLSSHDMSEVEELCAELTVINHGRIVFSGTVDELRTLAPAAIHVLHTSDDAAALDRARGRPGLKVRVAAAVEDGLEVSADVETLDAYIVALGCAGIAIRALERRTRSLESLFLELTERADADGRTTASDNASASPQPSAVLS